MNQTVNIPDVLFCLIQFLAIEDFSKHQNAGVNFFIQIHQILDWHKNFFDIRLKLRLYFLHSECWKFSHFLQLFLTKR
jgi:hypothetical protein